MAFYRFIGTPEAKEGKNLIVDFTASTLGTVIVDDWGEYEIGEVVKSWINCKDTAQWIPCADPRQSRTNRMLKAMK